MNDEKIFKIALLTTIVGLFALIITSGFVNPEEITIDKIDKSKIDNQVELTATISSITITKSQTKIIKLVDTTGTINMVIFPTVGENITLNENDEINIIATVTQYKGELELIVENLNDIKIK